MTMNILETLNLKTKEKSVISLVGGGGKTSIMFRLGDELKQLNKNVLLTTTTAVYYPGQALYDQIFLWDDEEKLPAEIGYLKKGGITFIGSRVMQGNKLKGIPRERVDELFHYGIFDNILVEADGAKGRPIKAPDCHEPVIPASTSHLIGVIGFDCYGRNIESDWVHRPHLLASVADKRLGEIIDAEVIIKLVLSQMGLFKNCPQTAQKVLFINKVEDTRQLIAAESIGNSVLTHSMDIKKVLIGNVFNIMPVWTFIERAAQ